jgi:tetratricopeptide (TPR) repeat protein
MGHAAIPSGALLIGAERWDDARANYHAVGARYPGDWQVRYRVAFLQFARGSYDAAAQSLEAIVNARAPVPRWLRATALVSLGWTYDVLGRCADAVTQYARVRDDFEDEAVVGDAHRAHHAVPNTRACRRAQRTAMNVEMSG